MFLFDLDVLKSDSTIPERMPLRHIIRFNGVIQLLLCVFNMRKNKKELKKLQIVQNHSSYMAHEDQSTSVHRIEQQKVKSSLLSVSLCWCTCSSNGHIAV